MDLIFTYLKVYWLFLGLGSLVCSNSELTCETMNPFRNFGRTPWVGDRPLEISVPTRNNQTKRDVDIYTSMPRAGFEPTLPVFERPWLWLFVDTNMYYKRRKSCPFRESNPGRSARNQSLPWPSCSVTDYRSIFAHSFHVLYIYGAAKKRVIVGTFFRNRWGGGHDCLRKGGGHLEDVVFKK